MVTARASLTDHHPHGNARALADRRTRRDAPSVVNPSLSLARAMNVVILPGSGCTPTRECNYYAWLESELKRRNICDDVRMSDMPDPHVCRRNVWVPFVENELKLDGASIVIGHSSGAVCALRLAERNRVRGVVLVAGYDDDLGDANERASGYFGPDAFDYDKIRENCDGRIDCVIGMRDYLVEPSVQIALAEKLRARETRCENRSHFFTPPAEEIIEAIERMISE